MTLFHVIPDAQAILRRKGVYRQVPLYTRNGKIYARYGAGFVLLLRSNNTTSPDLSWEELFDPGATVMLLKNADPTYCIGADEPPKIAAPHDNYSVRAKITHVTRAKPDPVG